MTTTTKKGGINLISSDDSGESADFGYKTLITPPMTKRRMSFGRNEVGGPSTAHASSRVLVSPNPSMSQSQNVGSEGVKEMATYFDVLCALCSVKERNEIWHGNRNQQDDQSCTEYKKHCFKCGSSKHISRSCFTLKFKEQSKSGQFGQKRCYTCFLNTNANGTLHDSSDYGNRFCPFRNCIRFVSIIFEDPNLRPLFNEKFPAIQNMQSNKEVVYWMSDKDEEGFTWYGDVMKWIKDDIISICHTI